MPSVVEPITAIDPPGVLIVVGEALMKRAFRKGSEMVPAVAMWAVKKKIPAITPLSKWS